MQTPSQNPIRAFQPVTSKLLTHTAMKCMCAGLLSAGLLDAAPPWEEGIIRTPHRWRSRNEPILVTSAATSVIPFLLPFRIICDKIKSGPS